MPKVLSLTEQLDAFDLWGEAPLPTSIRDALVSVFEVDRHIGESELRLHPIPSLAERLRQLLVYPHILRQVHAAHVALCHTRNRVHEIVPIRFAPSIDGSDDTTAVSPAPRDRHSAAFIDDTKESEMVIVTPKVSAFHHLLSKLSFSDTVPVLAAIYDIPMRSLASIRRERLMKLVEVKARPDGMTAQHPHTLEYEELRAGAALTQEAVMQYYYDQLQTVPHILATGGAFSPLQTLLITLISERRELGWGAFARRSAPATSRDEFLAKEIYLEMENLVTSIADLPSVRDYVGFMQSRTMLLSSHAIIPNNADEIKRIEGVLLALDREMALDNGLMVDLTSQVNSGSLTLDDLHFLIADQPHSLANLQSRLDQEIALIDRALSQRGVIDSSNDFSSKQRERLAYLQLALGSAKAQQQIEAWHGRRLLRQRMDKVHAEKVQYLALRMQLRG